MKKLLLWLNLCAAFLTPVLRADIAHEECPVLILGSGVAAMTAATYLARGGVPPVVITGPALGGMITQSPDVQNWPGEISIPGADLTDNMKIQAESVGADFRLETAIAANFSERPFTVSTRRLFGEKGQRNYKAHSVIIAMGATPKLLNIPGETGKGGYWLRGVYNCAVCDGALYKDKIVAVVGGGDSALVETQYLSQLAKKVHVFVRRDEFRTVEKERMKQIISHPNVEVHYNTIIREIKGDGQKMTSLMVSPASSTDKTEVQSDALFLAIGSKPNTELFQGQLELDAQGYIVLKDYQQTSVKGVYASGDVADREFKQAITAAGTGATAALQAQKDLISYRPISKAAEVKGPFFNKVIEVTSKEQLSQELQNFDGFIFIDFYSTYCGPCRTFSPLYENWAKEYGNKIKFLKINADVAADVFETYQIRVVPTLVILDKKGNIVRKCSGFREISEVDKRLEKIKNKGEFSAVDFK